MAGNYKGLNSLIRLSDAALNDRRRELNALQEREEEIKRKLDELEEEKLREQSLSRELEAGAFAYSGYAQGTIHRRKELERQLAALQPMLEQARDAMAEAFQELKRYQIALDLRKKSDKEAADRKATIAMDEISLNMHRRNQAGAEGL
ncbi:MAG: flagellar FliJ family protein [Alphaproteobacteria bacterium]|nr:flagellar FliJ family protein [Alphaproteobacteria bacterium]